MKLDFLKNKNNIVIPLVAIILLSAVVSFSNLSFIISIIFLGVLFFVSLLYVDLEYLFYALIFLFPITTTFKGYYVVDWIALCFLFVFFLRFLYSIIIKKNIKVRLPLFFTFVLFFISTVASFTFSVDKIGTLKSILYLIFLYFAYLSFPVSVIRRKEQILVILKIFVFIGLIDACFGFISLFGQLKSGLIYGAFPVSFFGKNFLGTSRNTLSQVMTLTIPALIAVIYFKFKKEREEGVVRKYKGLNIYEFGIIVFFLFVSILTLSRSGLIAMIATFLMLVLGYSHIHYREYFGKIFIVTVFSALVFGYGIYFFYSKSDREGFTGSIDYRYGIAQISLDLFSNHPLIGSGFGMFKTLLASNSWHNLEYSWGGVTEAHSWAQKIIVEQGVFGFITFALFLFNLYYFSLKYYFDKTNSKDDRMMMVFLITIATTQIIFNTFDWMYYNFRMWIPMSLPLIFLSMKNKGYNFIITNEINEPKS